jgi:hypothetical protein
MITAQALWMFSRWRNGAGSSGFGTAHLEIREGMIGNFDKQDPF